MGKSQNVRVCARFRPISEREKEENVPFQVEIKYIEGCRVEIDPKNSVVYGELKFNFDHVFDPETTQQDFYDKSCKQVIDDVLKGYNGTIFAYGQTGSGKTWSMMGSLDKEEDFGLIPRAAKAIFDMIEESTEKAEYKISCSYLEIYNETIQDLLDTSKKNLQIRESPQHGIYVPDLTEEYVGSEQEIFDLLEIGASNRVVSFTQMNAQSSRSHSVFMVKIHTTCLDGATRNANLNLVDLAGSEKVGKTGATGQTLEEAKKINQSLSTLGHCINALVENKKHIPFRDSKLTRILQESLGGNSKTTMICACSPHPFNIEETISTLKFGQRAKSIQCDVKINSTKSAKELQTLVDKLQQQLKQLRSKNQTLIKQLELWKEGKPFSENLLNELCKNESKEVLQEKDGNEEEEFGKEGSENKELESEGLKHKTEMELSDTAFAELQMELEKVKAEFHDEKTALEDELVSLMEENDLLTSKIKHMEEEKTVIEEDIEELLDENESLSSKLKEKENETTFNQKQLELEKAELEKELKDAQEELKELEKKMKETKQTSSLSKELQKTFSSDENLEELTKQVSESAIRGKIMAELEKLRADNQLYLERIDQLKEKVYILENQLTEERMQNVELDSEFTIVENANKREVNMIKEDLNNVKDEAKRAENSRIILMNRYENVKAELNQDLAKIKTSEKTETDLKNKIVELKKEIVNRDEENARLKLRLEKERLEKTESTDIGQDLELFVSQLYTSNMRQVREAADIMEKRKDETIKSLRITIEREKIETDDLVKKLNKTIEEQTATIGQQKKLYKKQSEELTSLSQEKNKLAQDLSILKGQIQLEKDKNATKTEDLQKVDRIYKEHITKIEATIESLTIEREDFKQQITGALSDTPQKIGRNWANEIMELRANLRKVTNERNKLEEEANHSRKENMSYRKKLKSLTEKLDLQRNRSVQLLTELETLKTQQSLKRNEKEEFRKQKEELQNKIDELLSALETVQKSSNLRSKRTRNIAVPVKSSKTSKLNNDSRSN